MPNHGADTDAANTAAQVTPQPRYARENGRQNHRSISQSQKVA